ncbi:hypothetical protein [Paenibacillus oleatilyticus]|uniref:hypothetical protein n=1 Tax=Paenibacillus oleatilyticus TaxID=2594886 RepID=UPI001C1F3095|nr:hypothetical protein [Paenibacillus oleatilyticus]MBU7317821.1 hypothetical protein [Paenibacillus oleatilyticus]
MLRDPADRYELREWQSAAAGRLREAGATVYVTGRSSRGQLSDMGRTETIEEAAEQGFYAESLAAMQECRGLRAGQRQKGLRGNDLRSPFLTLRVRR